MEKQKITLARYYGLLRKIAFVRGLSDALKENKSLGFEKADLDAFCDASGAIREYMVITYKGGAKKARNCGCNSDSANLKAFADLLQDSPLDQYPDYEGLKKGSSNLICAIDFGEGENDA